MEFPSDIGFMSGLMKSIKREKDPEAEKERLLAVEPPVSDLRGTREPQVERNHVGTAIDLAAKQARMPTPSRPNRRDVAQDMDAEFDWRETIRLMRDVMRGKVSDPLQPENPNAFLIVTLDQRMEAAKFLKEARLGKAPASVEVQHNHNFDMDLSRLSVEELLELERITAKVELISEGEGLSRRAVVVDGEVVHTTSGESENES